MKKIVGFPLVLILLFVSFSCSTDPSDSNPDINDDLANASVKAKLINSFSLSDLRAIESKMKAINENIGTLSLDDKSNITNERSSALFLDVFKVSFPTPHRMVLELPFKHLEWF